MSKKTFAAIVPYASVVIGLLGFHSAWAAMISYHLAMVAVLLFFRKVDMPFRNLLPSENQLIAIIALVLGGVAGLLLNVLWPFLSISPEFNSKLSGMGLTDRTWPAFLVYFIAVNAVLEECYWRGFLGSDNRGIVPNDLLFSGYHIIVIAGFVGAIWLPVAFLAVTLVGWAWRQARRLGGGLLAPMASHLAADAAVILTIYYMAVR